MIASRLAGAALALSLLAAGCAPVRPGCGVLACVSSPYLRARGAGIVGKSVNQAMIHMGGRPTDAIPNDKGGFYASWVRRQDDRDMGPMVCLEAVEIMNGMVVDYMTQGELRVSKLTPEQVVASRYRAMSLEALKAYERNARKHDPAQLAMLEQSLEAFGWTRPVGIADGTIIFGHGITEAARNLLKEGRCPKDWPDPAMAPVVDLSHLSEAERRAYVLADNELGQRSSWDRDVLKDELRGLQGMGADLGVLGFLPGELEELLAPAEIEEEGGDADAVPDEPPFAVTERGEVWLLGAKVTCPKCGKSTPAATALRRKGDR